MTEVRYANNSFILWGDLMENEDQLVSLKVDITMIKNLMGIAYENIASIDE